MMPVSVAAPRVVVVGGSQGIGASTSLHLAREGWEVIAVARDPSAGEQLVATARSEGLDVQWKEGDVTDPEQMRRIFDQIGAGGGLQACVVTAGRNLSRTLLRRTDDGWERHSVEEWDDLVRTNLAGTFYAARAAAPHLADQGGGVLVLLSSCVRHGSVGQGAYAATKAAIGSLARTWAHELGRAGVRVVAVAPGVVQGTALQRRFDAEPRYRHYMEDVAAHQALGEFAEEDEIAAAVSFVLRSPTMTGTTMEIDAGGLPPRILRDRARGR